MKGVSFLETSIIIGLVRNFDAAYKDSWINRSIEKFLSQVKVCVRHSFLGRITEMGEEYNSEILDNSKVVRWIVNSYNVRKNGIVNYLNSSIIINSIVEVKKELYFLPVKAGGMIVFTAVLTNTLLSLLMHKEINLFGWGIRGMLLLAAYWGMFCEVTWGELKRTSSFAIWVKKNIS